MAQETKASVSEDTTSVGNDNSGIPVAQSDYHAALRAIGETFQEARSSETSSFSSWQDDPLAKEFTQAVEASLVQSLSRIVLPTESDQDYHDIIDPYHVVVEDDDDDGDDENENELGGEDQTQEQSSEDDNEETFIEEEEFSESDLLDAKACKEAQRLRRRVRDMSQRVQQIRERAVQRAEELEEEKSSSSSFLQQSQPRIEMESNSSSDKETSSPSSLVNEEFDASVQRLMELVNNPKWSKMITESKKLQDTIDVVLKEQNRPLSQTDVAIISCNNSSSEDDLNDLHAFLSQDSEEEEDMSPQDRLAAFFYQLQ